MIRIRRLELNGSDEDAIVNCWLIHVVILTVAGNSAAAGMISPAGTVSPYMATFLTVSIIPQGG
jgi:hypothetical protein